MTTKKTTKILDLATFGSHMGKTARYHILRLDKELAAALIGGELRVTLCGVVGVGPPDNLGFYRLHIHTGRRWWAIEEWVSPSQDPLKKLLRLGNGAAAHVVGGVTEVLAHPTSKNVHLHAVIGDVLGQLARAGRGPALARAHP